MPRIGVTYAAVAQTAIQLQAQHVLPTIEEVRRVLGTGSHSTIHRHLKAWRAQQDQGLNLPPQLPEPLLVTVKGLYDALQSEANQRVETAQRTAEETLRQLQHQCFSLQEQQEQLMGNHQALERVSAQLQSQTREQAQLIEGLKQEREKTLQDHTHLQVRLKDKLEEITRLTQHLKQAQANLDHYRETTREQRFLEQELQEKEFKALNETLKTLKHLLDLTQQEKTTLQQELKTLSQENTQAHSQNKELQQQMLTIQAKLADTEKSFHQLKEVHLSHQQTQQQYDQHVLQLFKAQNDLQALEKQEALHLEQLKALKQDNQTLKDEKWTLAQEKFRLEGQLKQLQLTEPQKTAPSP